MRILISSLILFALISCTKNKEFEGYIDYHITMTAFDPSQVTHEELVRDFGTKSTTYHKKGMFKDLSNAQTMQIQLFLPNVNKLYSYSTAKSDPIEEYDIVGQKTEYNYELHKNIDTILGYSCNLLIAKNEQVEIQYYFAPQLYINPKYYDNFTSWNKREIMEKIQAATLRLIIQNKTSKMVSDAINIRIEPLNDSIFMVPSDRII